MFRVGVDQGHKKLLSLGASDLACRRVSAFRQEYVRVDSKILLMISLFYLAQYTWVPPPPPLRPFRLVLAVCTDSAGETYPMHGLLLVACL